MVSSNSLFTELTQNEEANLSGGSRNRRNKPQVSIDVYITIVNIFGDIYGAGGGAGSGGAILGNSGDATGGGGVNFVFGGRKNS
jgi:hypothetical protein